MVQLKMGWPNRATIQLQGSGLATYGDRKGEVVRQGRLQCGGSEKKAAREGHGQEDSLVSRFHMRVRKLMQQNRGGAVGSSNQEL